MAMIEFKNVGVGYDGKTVAPGLSFSVTEGCYLCIVGENGAGKSTAMKTLLGLLKPVSGEIVFDKSFRQCETGYLPQQTQVQKDFPATVFEVVLSGCLNQLGLRPFFTRAQKNEAEKWIERLGISNLKKKSYRELSGGQQQRVLLARALCASKRLIVLDEPVSGLDPAATQSMYSLIYDINRVDKVTVIMVSHDIAAALKYSTHILQISSDETFFGKTEEYINSEAGKRFTGRAGESDA